MANTNSFLTTPVPQPPYTTPMTMSNGLMTQAWMMWFQQIYLRLGGNAPIDPSIPIQLLAQSYALLYSQAVNPPAATSYLYTVPDSVSQTVIDSLVVKNVTAIDTQISVWIIPTGQSVSDAYKVIDAQTIGGGVSQTLGILSNVQLGTGASILLTATTPNSILVSLSGREVS